MENMKVFIYPPLIKLYIYIGVLRPRQENMEGEWVDIPPPIKPTVYS